MRGRVLIGGLVLAAVLGGAALLFYRSETKPIEKRGSAKVEFDPGATPEAQPAPRTGRGAGWPTFGHDAQRTKVSPYPHRPPYERTWRADLHDTIEFPPSTAYGNVYVAQQKGVFLAVNGKTGRKVFPKKRFKRCAASSPTISKGWIYQSYMDWVPCPQGAGNPTGFVTAINAKTGKEKWRFKAQPIESSPLLQRGILYVGSWDHNVYAISAKSGRKIWSFGTDGKVNTSAAYSKGRIFIATDAGTVYALGARSGKLAWKAQSQARLGSREFFYASPAVAYGRVYIGNTDGTMYAFGQRSGKLLWARPLGSYIYSAAAVDRRRVFVGTYDGKFFALDAATGDTKWQRTMPSAVHAPPVVMGGIVYASTCSSCGSAASRAVKRGKDSTTGFDVRTGKKRWWNNGGKYASPIIADADRVYFTGRSRVYALEPKRRRPQSAVDRRKRAAQRAGRRAQRQVERQRAAKRRQAERRRAAKHRQAQRRERAAQRRAAARRRQAARQRRARERRAAARRRQAERRRRARERAHAPRTTIPRWW
jgi:outer membrane protein assembly factor BamB